MVEPARPGKRPMKSLTSQEKLDAISRIKELGESKASVARKIGVPESTLRGWCKSEDKIRALVNNSASPNQCATPKLRKVSNYENPTSCGEDETIRNPEKRFKQDLPNSAQSYLELIKNLVASGNVTPLRAAVFLTQLGFTLADLNGLMGTTTKPNPQQETPPPPPPPAPAPPASEPKTFGLVENGLVYTTTSSKDLVLASTTKSLSEENVPVATEKPLSSVPSSSKISSERRTTETSDGNKSASQSTKNNQRLIDEQLYNWLSQQHQEFMGRIVAPFSPSLSPSAGSWFWQLYKQCDMFNRNSRGKVNNVKNSLSEVKALIDLVLNCNNNNDKENVPQNLNNDVKIENDDTKSITFDEALEHAEKFTKWIEYGNDPLVTQVHVSRMRSMVDSMRKQKYQPKNCKRSRK